MSRVLVCSLEVIEIETVRGFLHGGGISGVGSRAVVLSATRLTMDYDYMQDGVSTMKQRGGFFLWLYASCESTTWTEFSLFFKETV